MKLPSGKDIQAYVTNHQRVKQLLSWAKRKSLPGFYRIPIYDVVEFLVREVQKHDLVMRANSMAFSFFLSLFPSIIVLFTLVAFFPVFENFSTLLHTEIMSIMPNKAGENLFQSIQGIATKQRGDLLSISFLLAIVFSSNGMTSMMRGFEKSYRKTFKKRNALQKQWVAIQLTLALGLLLIASVTLIVAGGYIIHFLVDYIKADIFTRISFYALRWIAILFLLYFSVSVIYRYGAATRRKIRWFSPGATLATVLSIIASVGFSFYVDNFGRYNELYGPIGAIIVLMLWIQINSFSLLVGFELNASIAVNRDMRSVVEEG